MNCCVCGKEIIINHGSIEMNGAYCSECIKLFEITCEPTRQCLVCGCKEHSDVNIVNTDKPWLCHDCRDAILKARFMLDKM